jgi:triosephosphate isomerase
MGHEEAEFETDAHPQPVLCARLFVLDQPEGTKSGREAPLRRPLASTFQDEGHKNREGFSLRPLIAANWKMYKTAGDALMFLDRWNSFPHPPDREIAFFPSFTLLHLVAESLQEGQSLGAQDCHEKEDGAFTGEISCRQIKDAGCRYVLVGHSERRHVFNETDARIGAKFSAALAQGLRPVLCVGETLAQREAGATLGVVLAQLEAGLAVEAPEGGFDVAYEPVWAIGTGKVAKPEDAREVHEEILTWLRARNLGVDCRVLYGGSVKPENAAALMATPGVHGLLVGGASLDPETFSTIVEAGR